ncbi:2-amino-4-hydroxy-6-hydroxymethyldihydropteridine diphosphokinase [Rheinheimera soli]|jgi:2-amino-4-hydroxy-6-hydroxymethyldihydropteridine diphosphokinase|uniref:2-amino-4-hydroxy-6-hydroxymethyldihydropteridine pyrophosphokinase n=1 Tax=Rheinheimera soli TaxID=443616 RepID=A0ABU1VYD6_9GAMM|nr:2-amino-4-hydroxy-6-hydroxymethyldihydropteridine diphosphokinase [Rheinheimera soli]MDR7120483.1 2-amino-4-hydroxy-6-hydroxymethyldihydropteridine diphosphokinase [Rheinheimera soli]
MADTLAYIGLGANLNQPVQQLERAVLALQHIKDTELVQVSGFYGSKPMGPQDQPDYVNAVALLSTRLSADDLLTRLQQIELEQGRQRKDERWGPRTLDLDILLFGDESIQTERLTVPHYGMKVREFVLYPLAELNLSLMLPDGTSLTELLATVPLNGLSRL